MAVRKAFVIVNGENQQIQSGDYVSADSLGIGSAGGGALSLLDNNTWGVLPQGNLTGPITSIGLTTSINSQTGTGSTFAMSASPVFTTSITTPQVLGGSAAGSVVEYRSTSGTGTTTAIGHNFTGGTNGATVIMTMLNSGNVNIGNAVVNPAPTLGLVRIGQGTSIIDIGQFNTGNAAIWMGAVTPSTTNWILNGTATNSGINVPSATGLLQFSFANATVNWTFSKTACIFSPGVTSSGAVTPFQFNTPSNTGQTAGTESRSYDFSTASIQFASNTTVSNQKFFNINAPTYSFASAGGGVFTNLATLAVSGAPISGTNAAPVDVHAILIRAGAVNGAGTAPTRSYGMSCQAQTGATTNYCAQFTGGNVGIGVNTPTALLHIAAGTATANTAPLQFANGTRETTARGGLREYENNHYCTNNSLVRYGLGGTIFDYNTDAGNVTTAETDLYSSTTIASTLAVNKDKLTAEYGGVFVSSGTATRQIKVYFAGTAILDTGALTLSLSSAWTLYVSIIRVSATVVRYSTSLTTQGAALAAYTSCGELTGLTLSNTNILKVTGTAAGVGAATNDIVAKMGYVSISSAA